MERWEREGMGGEQGGKEGGEEEGKRGKSRHHGLFKKSAPMS